jgi:tetratricopeptide (TPR) repeat protein
MRWYHDRCIDPHIPKAKNVALPYTLTQRAKQMKTLFRLLSHVLPITAVAGLFLLFTVDQRAQTQFPSPNGHVNDFANVIDADTKARLESLLQNLKAKTQIEFAVATVDSTGDLPIEDFAKNLARDWNIGTFNGRAKSLLLVVSAGSKQSFTQYSRLAQRDLAEGILGDVSLRMRTPLAAGRFGDAINVGVTMLAGSVAQKAGVSIEELDQPANIAAATPPEVIPQKTGDSSAPIAPPSEPKKTRPRAVTRLVPEVKNDTVKLEKASGEQLGQEAKTEAPKIEKPPIQKLDLDDAPAPVTKSTKPDQADIDKQPNSTLDDDESEEVELTLTKPLAERAVLLKKFLETHPESKSRTRATELLISTHAGLGDQRLKNGDNAGGVEQLMLAISESNPQISDELFKGVISQIPMNLYLRGEKDSAYRASGAIEEKFGSDPKRLLAVAGFYLGIERGDEATRVGEAVVKMAPDLAEAHRVMAVGLHFSLRLDEAASEYKKALELDPTLNVARGSLADLSRAAGKFDVALALYNDQLKEKPKDPAATAGVVISLLELGRRDEAMTAMTAALADNANNLPLLAGAAYWFTAHDDPDKGFEYARRAVALEPRYTWAQIALARSLLALKQPLDAERAMRYARQYGKFPTLNYELGTILASMGLYDEAAEALHDSFSVKDDEIQAQLASRLTTRKRTFGELLAPERQASIFQMKAADSTLNASRLKALVAFSDALAPGADGQKIDAEQATAAATAFAAGDDSMRVYRQLYAASRLLRYNVGLRTALELVQEAKKAADEGLNVTMVALAVQADEFREPRARAISAGTIPNVADAPRTVMSSILKGRIEDLNGWILFNDDKVPEAIEHLKLAESTLPVGTPAWRIALWHLGAAYEQSGKQQDALDYYIKSYTAGEPDAVHRTMIEQLYRKMNGSLDGLDEKIGAGLQANVALLTGNPPPEANTVTPKPSVDAGTEPKPDPTPASGSATENVEKPLRVDPKTELTKDAKSDFTKPDAPSPNPAVESVTATPPPTPTPTPTPIDDSGTEESLRATAARTRSTVRITGRVLDADKNALGSVAVVLISPSGTVLAATTNNEGVYTFTVSPSLKTYRVIPSKDGYSFAPIDKALTGIHDDQQDVDFVANKTP